MDQRVSVKKWEAKVSTRLYKASARQIWPLLEDFFGLHKWFPGLATCHGVHGVNGRPDCVRYCAGFGLKNNSSTDSKASWSKERLVSIDHEEMTLSYEIVECNIGFESYVSTLKVVPLEETGSGCVVEWWISLDPVFGWDFEQLVEKYQVGLELMVKKMEDEICGLS